LFFISTWVTDFFVGSLIFSLWFT